MNSLSKEIDMRLGNALANNETEQHDQLISLIYQLRQHVANGFRDNLGTPNGITTQLALKVRQLGGGKLPGKYTLEQLRRSPEWKEITNELNPIDRLSIHGVLGRITSNNEEFYHPRSRLEVRNLKLVTVPVSAPPDKKLRDLRGMDIDDLLGLRGIKLPSAIFIYLAFHS